MHIAHYAGKGRPAKLDRHEERYHYQCIGLDHFLFRHIVKTSATQNRSKLIKLLSINVVAYPMASLSGSSNLSGSVPYLVFFAWSLMMDSIVTRGAQNFREFSDKRIFAVISIWR